MVISPGPGNTILASMGARYGLAGTARFWLGFEIGNLLLCVLYGAGLGQLLLVYPGVAFALKWVGVAYLLYLAWAFFRDGLDPTRKSVGEQKRLGLVEGVLAVMVNPKIHSAVLAMFAQFVTPGQAIGGPVQVTAVFMIVSVLCHCLWIVAGAAIFSRFQSPRAIRAQAWAFALCMAIVAVFSARA
jgi:threonine/homoserine/homoserine lactone efflux protein